MGFGEEKLRDELVLEIVRAALTNPVSLVLPKSHCGSMIRADKTIRSVRNDVTYLMNVILTRAIELAVVEDELFGRSN